jgi:hypothetical protein
MRRTTPSRPALAPRAAAVAATLLATLGACSAGGQEGPVRQNRPAGEPPPARPATVPSTGPTWPLSPAAAGSDTRPATDPLVPELPEPGQPAVGGPDADVPAIASATTALPPPTAADARAALAKAFAELAHPDPAVRVAARARLIGMSREHLTAFEGVVRDSLPLAPAQAAALAEIATQAYLAGEPYAVASRDGFLGVLLAEVTVAAGPAADDPANPPARQPFAPPVLPPQGLPRQGLVPPPGGLDLPGFDLPATTGVAIMSRMPGFCGARAFQDGDVVLSIVVGRQRLPTRTTEEMRTTVVAFGAGQAVQFELLRQGQIVRVSVVLDPRPTAAVPRIGMDPRFLEARREAASAYWARTFAPMLREKAG